VCVALVIQHAMHMRRFVLFGFPDTIIIFCTLSKKRHDFRKKKLLKLNCVFWFSLQLLSEKFFVLRKT